MSTKSRPDTAQVLHDTGHSRCTIQATLTAPLCKNARISPGVLLHVIYVM